MTPAAALRGTRPTRTTGSGWIHTRPGSRYHRGGSDSATLADIFRASVADFADRPAAESFGTRLTYGRWAAAAAAIRRGCKQQGLQKGDRVAIMLPNVMAYPAILFGDLAAGGTVVNVNPLYTARELADQLKDASARMLFVLENFGRTVEKASPSWRSNASWWSSPGDLLGIKGLLVNLVSRHMKKAVPRFNCATRRLRGRPRGRREGDAEAGQHHARGHGVPAIYRRDDRRRQRRDPPPPQRRRECRTIRGVDAALLRGAHRPCDGDGAAALPHLRAHG